MIQKKNPSKCHPKINSKTTDKQLNMLKSVEQQIEELKTQELQKEMTKMMRVRTLHISENEAKRRKNKYLKAKVRNKMARKSRQINYKINKK